MKVLVTNFDYAFYDLNYFENIEAAGKFVDAGNLFIIATARNITQLEEELTGFIVPYSILICNDGAIIYDSEENILYRKPIEKEDALGVFNTLDKEKNISEIYMDNALEHSVSHEERAFKIIAKPRDYEKAQKLLEKLRKKYPMIDGYINESWMHIINKEVSKKAGIDFLLSYYGLDPEQVYVIGSAINDLSMVEAYKSFVLESADEEVKEKGNTIVKNFKEVIDLLLK